VASRLRGRIAAFVQAEEQFLNPAPSPAPASPAQPSPGGR
jgi:hypothetical protein